MGPVCCIEVRREGGPPVLEMCGEAVGSRAGILKMYSGFVIVFFFPASSDDDQNDDDCEDVVRFTAWLSRGRRIWLVSNDRPPTFQAASCKLSYSCVWDARVW